MFQKFDRMVGFIVVRLRERRTWLVIAAVVAVIFLLVRGDDAPVVEEAVSAMPQVYVGTVGSQNGQGSVLLLGTVAAKTQAKLEAEAGGRVVAVPVTLGQTVSAGAVIAQLENASERAAVLQAEGAYEAALAASAQSTVGVAEAENALRGAQNGTVTTVVNSYTTTENIIRTTIDQYFANPNTTIPGLRISGQGQTEYLNSTRNELRSAMPVWQTSATTLDSSDNLRAALTEAETQVMVVLGMVDVFLQILPYQNDDDAVIRANVAEMTAARTTLTNTLAALNSAESALTAAEETLNRAKISATAPSTAPSASDAQIKQALGALRAAEANLAKTVIRTPISGTVNSLAIRAGDFVGVGTAVAEIANNNGLEITTFINEQELPLFTVGTPVMINRTATGTVTNVAPAVDAATGKIEIRIGVTDAPVKPGDTVEVAGIVGSSVETATTISIPLTAIKFDGQDSFVFTLTSDNHLERTPVTVGAVIGDSIVIESGITNDTVIVLDARGLTVGTKVEPITK